LIILIILGEEDKLWSSSLCSFLQSPVTYSLFGPNILLNTLFSNILSLCSSLNVRDQVSRPYRTTSKIVGTHRQMLWRQKIEEDIWSVFNNHADVTNVYGRKISIKNRDVKLPLTKPRHVPYNNS
jgi:hypothetical protein